MNRRQLLVWVVALSLSIICFRTHVYAAEQIVELRLQTVRTLRGIVYLNDDIVKGAKIVELASDWKTERRETHTDEQGRFSFDPVKGRTIYYLQITVPAVAGVNPLRVPVKLNRLWGKGLLRLQLQLA